MKPAISQGPELMAAADFPTALGPMLKRAAQRAPEQGIVHIQRDGGEVFQSYAQLCRDAEAILGGLRRLGLMPGDKVIFQLDRTEDFLTAFWGCALGGFVPLPLAISPTYQSATGALAKLQNAWHMLGRPVVLAGDALEPAVRSLPQFLELPDFRVASMGQLRSGGGDIHWHTSHEEDLALLLLTSGSTGLPKAVMLNHRNLLARSAGTCQKHGYTSDEVTLNWFPLDHVGGIVMFHLRDVFLACRQIQAPIELVLERPLRWLDWIDRHKATITWAPNFAYGLINDQAPAIESGRWDLSSLKFILNAGEAIVARTTRRFLSLLAPHGLRGDCMHPAWGMSETSSAFTYSDRFRLETSGDSDSFVGVGEPLPGAAIRIVDAADQCIGEGEIGRLQVKGPQITAGYFDHPALNAESFTSDGWFKTGDLGTLVDGQLTITGREKDVIIINGINYHGHEIEAVVEEIAGIEPSFTAATAVRDPGGETDKLAVFFHTHHTDALERQVLTREVRSRIVTRVGVNPSYLLPLEKQNIPKTAIGKIQRSQLRKRLEAGEFEDLLQATRVAAREYVAPRGDWELQVAELWQTILNVPRIGVHDDFFELGGHSLLATQILSRVRDAFHVSLTLRHLFEGPTVAQMCQALEQCCLEEAADEDIAELLDELEAGADEDSGQVLSNARLP